MTGPQDTTGATERPAAPTAAGGAARERRPDIERFLDYLQETRGLSRNTMAAYGNDLRQYAEYLGDQVAGWEVPATTVSGFLEMLISREYAASSQARKLAAVKAMYRYLVEEGVVGSDPSKDIGGARVTKKRPNIISVGEADRLLAAAAASSTPEGYRDSAMLELLYGTGMRVSEIVALDSVDIDIDRLVVNCGRGTNRERKIPFGPRVVQALGSYMREAREKLLGVRPAADPAGVLADHQRACAQRRNREHDHPAHPAPLVRHPPAAQRRHDPRGAVGAGPREPGDDPDIP